MSYFSHPAIEQAWQQTRSLLVDFIDTSTIDSDLFSAFGNTFDNEAALVLLQQWITTGDIGILPPIEVLPAADLNYALGAYSADNSTIYLSDEFLAQNTQNPDIVTNVLIEELGHFLDDKFNDSDAPGDEGALFSSLVRNEELDEVTFSRFKQEDDTTNIVVDGANLVVEQATDDTNPAFDLIGLTQLRNDPDFDDIDGTGFRVAVIDSGIDYSHPYLEFPQYWTGYDFVNDDYDPLDDSSNSHGTHVSGTIGASYEYYGVATDVQLIGLKGLESDYTPFNYLNDNDYHIYDALRWVLSNHEEYSITAVNMSIGDKEALLAPNEIYNDISRSYILGETWKTVEQLEAEGVTVISAAGNNYDNNPVQGIGSPGIFSTLVAGSVTTTDVIASNSQRLNPYYHSGMLFAPGVNIESTVIGGGYDESSGTSMASPHIAGSVALLQEAAVKFGDRTLSPEEVRDVLVSTADEVYDWDTGLYFPRLNVYNAVAEVQSSFDTDNSEPSPEPTPEPEPEPSPEPSPEPNQTIELFRFRNTTFDTGTYVFVGEGEKDAILNDSELNRTFELEGNGNPAFIASVEEGDDLIPFYRLRNLDISGTYLFVGEAEYDAIFASDSVQQDKWEQEGLNANGEDIPEFYLYQGNANQGNPFNRFQNTQNGTFLYAGENETDTIESDSNLSELFTNQGVAFESLS